MKSLLFRMAEQWNLRLSGGAPEIKGESQVNESRLNKCKSFRSHRFSPPKITKNLLLRMSAEWYVRGTGFSPFVSIILNLFCSKSKMKVSLNLFFDAPPPPKNIILNFFR